MNVSSEIFRMYDIRGVYGEDLNNDTVEIIGKGIGTFFLNHGIKKIAIARDNRTSGPKIKEILVKNLLTTGTDVLDLDIALNPFVYYSWFKLNTNASVIITASHNPAKYNGFKLSINKHPLMGDDYQELFKICQSGNFVKGFGRLEKYDIWPEYKNEIKKNIKLERKLKIVIDCGNGTAGLFAPEILKDLGCEVIPLYTESDGNFPNHDPYPQKVELYQKLIESIKESKADLGLSFDGDGDRLGIYDENGNFVENDRLAMVFAKDICSRNKNHKIVMNISTSLAVTDFIESCGGEVTLWKTGYPNISNKMKEIGAIFGGEISGHFFFKDKYFGYDDALYSALRALEIVTKGEESLSSIISRLPRYFETRENRIEVPEGKDKFLISQNISLQIKKDYPKVKVMDIDGIRFSFADGWGLVRPSNTESVISIRAEGKTVKKLEEIKKLIYDKLKENGIIFEWS